MTRCTPFDPLVDTETARHESSYHIRNDSCTPFDPLVDTETGAIVLGGYLDFLLHPLRSACGY